MKTIIRSATATDADAICTLFYATAVDAAHSLYAQGKAEELAMSYVNKNDGGLGPGNGHCFVAANADNEIVGCSSLQLTGKIDILCVHPKQRQQGIATQLLESLYGFADRMHLSTLTTASDLLTFSFFEKKGFMMQDSCSHEIAGIQLTTITLAKRLWL